MAVRSTQQNKSLHKWLEMIAHEANNQGLTLQDIVEVIRKIEIRPNKENLKQVVVHPYIKAAYDIDSTTQLTTQQMDELIDGVTKLFGQTWGITIPFPSEENRDEL